MAKEIIGIMFVCISASTPLIAKDDGITLDGLARSASLVAALNGACIDMFGTSDKDRKQYAVFLKTSYETYVSIGIKTFGVSFQAVLDREFERRHKEIEITGVDQWCNLQRARMEKLGDALRQQR